MNPELAKRAAEETRDEIQEAVKGADMVFVTCGLGGGTGTSASPVVARIAKELGCLTVAVVTKPSSSRDASALGSPMPDSKSSAKEVDAIIVIPTTVSFPISRRTPP